jgi:glycosyltransferase involved in cell wall biosynthesis
MLDILIPTFNRKRFVVANIAFLEREITKHNLGGLVKIIISDNSSDDGTYDALMAQDPVPYKKVMQQSQNVGLERNALSILNEATSQYVMYLGDDDQVPEGYLKTLVERLSKNPGIGVVIPGVAARYTQGKDVPVRGVGQEECLVSNGYYSQLMYGYLTHQLSGCVFKRDGLFDAYEHIGRYKNIYPFIFFALHCQEKYSTLYLPHMKIAVLEGNKKDWAYNKVGLLDEIANNYNAIYGKNSLKISLCLILICIKQSWRLRTNSIHNHAVAIKSIMNMSTFRLLFKIIVIPAMLPFLFKNSALAYLSRFHEK